MSEIGPELYRLGVYKETRQENMIPSYFPPNFTRVAPSLKSVFKEAKMRQPKAYIIEQVLELTPKPLHLPQMVEHNYIDKEQHTTDHVMYENNLTNLNHFYNGKWHFMLEPDFTNVLCDARFVKFEKIEINLVDEELEEWKRQYELCKRLIDGYDLDILNAEVYEKRRQEFEEYYLEVEHVLPEELPAAP
jgi:hypothetical protein